MTIPPDSIYCSITLSTRNKDACLAVTLERLVKQIAPFLFEIIVVDDGSTDCTEQVCRKFGVEYYYLDNKRYRNPAVARNVAFRAAKGEVIIAQSDDIVPAAYDSVARLVEQLRPGEFILGRTDNYRYEDGQPGEFIQEYCGPSRPVPYFFFGAMTREDLYAAGGYDEEFVEPCYDDNWLADCLIQGQKLQPRITPDVLAHHQFHGYPTDSHQDEQISKDLYRRKVLAAEHTGSWCNSGGSWRLEPREEVPEIPKVMNFFWVGNTMSWMRYMTLFSFRTFHPDWDIVLHQMDSEHAGGKTWQSIEVQDVAATDTYSEKIKELDIEIRSWIPLEGQALLAPAHHCDLFQWSLLAEEGGFYADMDILWVARLPYEKIKHANAVFCHTHEYMAIGFVGAAPKEPLFRDILQSATDNHSADTYQSSGAEAIYRLAGMWPNWGTIVRVGPNSIDALRKRYPAADIVVLADASIYPWYFREVGHIFDEEHDAPPGCCGIHWFGGDELAQIWNNKLTHENYGDYTNTFTKYAAKVCS